MKLSFRSLFRQALIAALVAVGLNALLYWLFITAGFISTVLPISPDGRPLSTVPVAMASILPVGLAAVVYGLLARLVPGNYRRLFTFLAISLLLLSFLSPFSIAEVPLTMAVSLNVMHVVVALATLFFLTKTQTQNA
ncbi:MAG TPA: hypothetical protein DCE41_25265 [Cytophagales bacterium]|nr:hypothetical protein [Cytophagales bacterium]HAA24208.1 hypothetical protein [Cytophagales bacterium]HAP64387.1 hypothetical protein [Cytophagales bacterium]